MQAHSRHPVAVLVEHALHVETERGIQRGRIAALALAGGLLVSFGNDRSLRMTLAVALLAITVMAVHQVLRRTRSRSTIRTTGWVSFLADATVCATALSAVADDPIDPISAITLMVAIEAAVRWGTRGAVFGGLLSGTMALGWAAAGYDAIGRDLPATSMAFRLLSPAVIALPVGLLIERLRRQREHTRRMFEHSNDATLIVAGRRIVAANPAAAHLAGVPVEQLVGQSFSDQFGSLLGVRDLADLLDTSRRSVPLVQPDGHQRWVAVEVEATEDAGLVFVSVRDVTEERVREEELRFQAWHDPLTGLPNRAALRARLTGHLGEGTTVGVVFLDLDDFKEVNDRHGHLAGDALLVEVAERLRQTTRDADAAYRWAGDEFCLVVDAADPEVLQMMTERIVDALRGGFHIGDHVVHVGASVGSAMARPGDTEDLLIARADAMMYRTKQPRRTAM